MRELALALALVLAACAPAAPPGPPLIPGVPVTAFTNVRIFDGEHTIERGVVLLQKGRVVALGDTLTAPAGATVVDGSGDTLLPGLIDAHSHAFDPDFLVEALALGVTTELDMLGDPHALLTMREEIAAEPAPRHADLYGSGFAATVEGGHGTEYGLRVPTLSRPEEADAWVADRLNEGSDYIKIIVDDFSAYGLARPTLDGETVAALIRAAHRHGKLAIVHIGTEAEARAALLAGADGLAHLFVGAEVGRDFGRFVAEHHAFVVPTLGLLGSMCGGGRGAKLAADPRLAAHLRAGDLENLKNPFPFRSARPSCAAPSVAVGLLREAGVPILAGTDAPNPGTAHGASLHDELALLVEAGLTPAQALAAATSVPAARFHLLDRGRLAPGLRADLLLVKGDPTRDIGATRDIVGVWKAGVAVERTP